MSSSQEDSSQSELASEPLDQSQGSSQRESNDTGRSPSSSSSSSTSSDSSSSSSSSSSGSGSGGSDDDRSSATDASQSGGAANAFMGAGLDLHGGAAAMAALTAGMPEPSMAVMGDESPAAENKADADEPQSQAALQRQSTSSNPMKDQGGDQADVVRRKVEELFPYFGDGQSITTTDFLELLSDMAIAADEEEVNTLVVDPDLIGLQEAMEAAVRLSGQGANTDAAVVTAAINVVQLTPWEYAKLKLTCGTDPGTLYKVKWSSLLPSPRQQLIGATVIALLLCCACVAMTVGLLWRSHRLSPERRMSEESLTFVANAVDGVGESAKTRTNETLQDAINLQGALISSHYDGMISGERARLQLRAGSARGGTVSVSQGVMGKRTEQLRNTLRAAVAVARTNENRTARSWLAPFHRDVAAASIVSAIEAGYVTVLAVLGDGQGIEVPEGYAGLTCGPTCQLVANGCQGATGDSLQTSRNASHAAFSVRVSTGGFLCASVRATANATQVAVEGAARLLASGALTGARPVTAVLDPSVSAFGASCSLVAGGESCVAPSFTVGEDFYVSERVSGVALVASIAESLRYDLTFAATTSTVAMLNSRTLPLFEVPWPAWEASLAVIDSTGSVNSQATPPRDDTQCLGTCQRLRVASAAQADALSRPEGAVPASAAQHDYVPRPVLAVASRLPSRGAMALVLESQLDAVANISVRETVAMFDKINVRITPWELAAATRDGVPSIGFFDRRSPCTAELTCFEDPVAGVVYRSDCIECIGLDTAEYAAAVATNSRATLQTAFTPRVAALCAQGLCQGTREEVELYVAALNSIPAADGIVVERSGDETFAFPNNARVLASSALVGRSSLAVTTLWPTDDYTSHGNDRLYIAVGLAPVVWFVLLLVQLMVARIVMEDIESEWAHYTTRMQEESQVFAAMVVDIFPIEVAERIMKGARRISDSSQLTFLFVNMCQFEAHYRSKLEPTVLCLFTSYYFMLLSHVAQQFRMYRVRTFGDAVFIAGGISDDRDSASFNAVCNRTLQAAAVIIELFSYQWTHTPAHVVCLRQVSSVDRAIVMPSVRIGVHCGSATLLVEPSTVGPPVFDVVGPSVGATVAVCNSAHTNTVNASEQVIEAARKAGDDFNSEFQFASATRRVSTHTGTVKTQLMRAANVAVPSRVVFAMGIRRATVRVYCSTEEKGGMANSTHGSQQDLGSVVSGVSRQSKVFA